MSGRCARAREGERDQKETEGTFGVAGNGEYTAAAVRTPASDFSGLGARFGEGPGAKEEDV